MFSQSRRVYNIFYMNESFERGLVTMTALNDAPSNVPCTQKPMFIQTNKQKNQVRSTMYGLRGVFMKKQFESSRACSSGETVLQ